MFQLTVATFTIDSRQLKNAITIKREVIPVYMTVEFVHKEQSCLKFIHKKKYSAQPLMENGHANTQPFVWVTELHCVGLL